MKTKIIIAIILLFCIGIIVVFINEQEGIDQTYFLPKGFEGCVVINYNVKGAPPLKIEDDGIIYQVPKTGIVNTSSSYDFGWVNEKHSGSYQLYAYYVDENGTIIEEVPKENIRFGPNGSTQAEGKAEKYFDYQIFGSEEVEKDGCPALGF